MKQVEFNKRFIKNYKRRIAVDDSLSRVFDERFILFKQGLTGPPLNDHALQGKMKGLRAFSVTGDIRVIYEETTTGCIFKDVGTHNQVYR